VAILVSVFLPLVLVSSDWFVLAAPLERFGVPSLPVSPRRRRLARLAIGSYLMLLLVPYGVAVWALVRK
jgi:hypothetical protein